MGQAQSYRNISYMSATNNPPERPPVRVEGNYLFQFEQQTIWRLMTDPDVLVASIRACKSVQKTNDLEYQIVLKFTLGIAIPEFLIDVVLSDLHEPECYKMRAVGRSRLMGSAAGDANVALHNENGHTRLHYSARVVLTGMLGKIAESVVQATAKKALHYFFAKLEQQLCATD